MSHDSWLDCKDCIILNSVDSGTRCDKHQTGVKPEEECNDIPRTDEEFWDSAEIVFPRNVKYNPLTWN